MLTGIDVLNRFPSRPSGGERQEGHGEIEGEDDANTVHVMMYMFPRQFGLHNAFTSTVDRRRTAQKFQDYTLREEEITQKFAMQEGNGRIISARVPRRLRGVTQNLVKRLRIRHGRCSYAEMLQYYCPVSKMNDRLHDKRGRCL